MCVSVVGVLRVVRVGFSIYGGTGMARRLFVIL